MVRFSISSPMDDARFAEMVDVVDFTPHRPSVPPDTFKQHQTEPGQQQGNVLLRRPHPLHLDRVISDPARASGAAAPASPSARCGPRLRVQRAGVLWRVAGGGAKLPSRPSPGSGSRAISSDVSPGDATTSSSPSVRTDTSPSRSAAAWRVGSPPPHGRRRRPRSRQARPRRRQHRVDQLALPLALHPLVLHAGAPRDACPGVPAQQRRWSSRAPGLS